MSNEEDRGLLPQEPCRYCHRAGGVWIVVDDSPFGKNAQQVVACDFCKNSWVAETGQVPVR